MRIRVYGARGIIPTPGAKTIKYGGNTSCIGLRLEGVDDFFIFDGGTGIRRLGEEFSSRRKRFTIRLFLSHFHHDHIEGLPLFIPFYQAGHTIHIYGPHDPDTPLERVIKNRLYGKFIQAGLGEIRAKIEYHELKEDVTIGDVYVSICQTTHPSTTLGYRVEYAGKSIAYLTDHEPEPVSEPAGGGEILIRGGRTRIEEMAPKSQAGEEEAGAAQAPKRDLKVQLTNKQYREFIRGCSVVIADAQYLPNEIELYRGWGHGSLNFVVNQAVAADVKKLIFFHHDPNRSDRQIDDMVAHYRELLRRKRSPLELVAAREVEEHTVE